MAAAIDSHCERYKWPYLQNQLDDFHKSVCKMLVFSALSSELKVNICEHFPLTN